MPADRPVSFPAHLTPQSPLLPALHAWEIYLNDQDRSHFTVNAFKGDIQLLISFLPPQKPIGTVTTDDLNRFIGWLQKGRKVPCSPKSLARRITSIKSFFRWLNRSGTIAQDPAEKVLQQSVISPLPTILTREEAEQVIQTGQKLRLDPHNEPRPLALVALLLATGIKKGECLGLSLNHIEMDAPTGPFLFVRYPGLANRFKERKILLPDTWVEVYREYRARYKPDDRVFPWSPRRLEYILEDLGKEAGLAKHLSFDMCRWTCAVTDWQTGVEPEKIRQKLGISKIQWREISHKLRQLAGDPPGAA